VSFATHIRPLFRERDRQSMTFAFDLWSVDDVRARAPEILAQIKSGSMPCDGAWSPGKVLVFERWTGSGMGAWSLDSRPGGYPAGWQHFPPAGSCRSAE
jgi:hypothetical protein